MTKRDWSSIHGEVKEAESMKNPPQWCGFQDGTKQRGEKLLLLSLALFNYIYTYIIMHCENKRLLNACMNENGMCVFA